jgi:hypothetical protein
MQYVKEQKKEKKRSTRLCHKRIRMISTVLLLILLISMMTGIAACRKPRVIFVETKFKVEAIPGDPDHYKISKALYARLLKIIKDLKAEIEALKVDLEDK